MIKPWDWWCLFLNPKVFLFLTLRVLNKDLHSGVIKFFQSKIPLSTIIIGGLSAKIIYNCRIFRRHVWVPEGMQESGHSNVRPRNPNVKGVAKNWSILRQKKSRFFRLTIFIPFSDVLPTILAEQFTHKMRLKNPAIKRGWIPLVPVTSHGRNSFRLKIIFILYISWLVSWIVHLICHMLIHSLYPDLAVYCLVSLSIKCSSYLVGRNPCPLRNHVPKILPEKPTGRDVNYHQFWTSFWKNGHLPFWFQTFAVI